MPSVPWGHPLVVCLIMLGIIQLLTLFVATCLVRAAFSALRLQLEWIMKLSKDVVDTRNLAGTVLQNQLKVARSPQARRDIPPADDIERKLAETSQWCPARIVTARYGDIVIDISDWLLTV